MAFSQIAAVTNGAAQVDAPAAPGAGTRHVRTLKVHNKDTASAQVIVSLKVSGTDYRLCDVTLAVGSTLHVIEEGDLQVLDTNSSIVVELGGAITTNELDITGSYLDIA